MIRTLYRTSKGTFSIDIPPTHWRVALRDAGGLFWVDLCDEPIEKVEPILRDTFGFHPLAIDDALRETHVPKIDNWGEAVYVNVHGVELKRETIQVTTREIDLFLGANFLVTLHAEPIQALDRLWNNNRNDPRRLEHGPDHLLYDVLDLVTSDYLPVVDELDGVIDELEEEVFAKPTQRTLNQIFSVRHAILNLRRIIGPQREVLNRLARDDYPFIDPKDRVYFRDVYDHLVRLADLNESLRDLISGTLDTYLSVIANRQNEIMKTLTITSVLMLPISFIAGFFGMNFTGLAFDSALLFWLAVASMIITPVVMLLWFRLRGWW
jgi:magnesium transporter